MMKRDASQIFSKAALDRLASPEQMDQLLTFGSARSWLALAGLLSLLAAATVWGFVGEVTTDVTCQGMLLRTGGVETVASLGGGQIAKLLVAPGDHLRADDPVATLLQPERTDELEAAQATVADLERQRARIASIRTGETSVERQSYDKQRAALDAESISLHGQLDRLRSQQLTEHGLLAKGLVTRSQISATDQSVAAAESSLSALTARRGQLEDQHLQATHSGSTEALQLDNQIAAARRHVDALQHNFASVSEVRTTVAGEVTELSARTGELVRTGSPIVRLQQSGDTLHAIVYAPADKAKQVRPGMAVQLSPSGLKREEYGFLRGTVTQVSAFPATEEALLGTVANEAFVKTLETKGAVSRIDVALEPIPGAPGTFRWSSPRGDALQLTGGTILAGSLVVRSQHPASLVIPFARQKMGLR